MKSWDVKNCLPDFDVWLLFNILHTMLLANIQVNLEQNIVVTYIKGKTTIQCGSSAKEFRIPTPTAKLFRFYFQFLV